MRIFAIAAALSVLSLSAHAQPPAGGQKLSEIIAKIEEAPDFHYIDEIDWDDRGYYEIEYYMQNGAKVEIKIDPETGETRR